jgi:AraC-like DNA-binding protein
MVTAMAQPTIQPSMVRIGALTAVPAILESLGADPATVLRSAGFDAALLRDPDNRIDFAKRSRLIVHCATVTACPHFGLLIGQQANLHSLGLVGLLVRYSPDVGTALRALVRYRHVHVIGASVSLVVDRDHAKLGYSAFQPDAEGVDQVGAGALAMYFNMLRDFCGRDWTPTEVCFAQRMPADVGPFRRFFRIPLRFDADEFALVFPARYLRYRLPEVDEGLRQLLQREIDLLDRQYREDFPGKIRSVLRTALITGHASAPEVATYFGMHRRTLNRHLNAFGIGFQDLVEEVRYEVARQMLEDSAMEVGQIAELLRYAAPGAFTRAFRRWSGTTPAAWRAARTRK